MDDVAISYATDGATVGAHLDLYDVFITQAEGKRKWQLESKPRNREESSGENLVDNPDVKLLSNFKADIEYVLEPGDILYIPPGYAHYGVSEGNSLSFSMGFRAPAVKDTLSSFCESVINKILEDELFLDKNRCPSDHPTELTMFSQGNFPQWPTGFPFPKEEFLETFGELVTKPVRGFWLDEETVIDSLPKNFILTRLGATRVCHMKSNSGVLVFLNGKSHLIKNLNAIEVLLREIEVNSEQLSSFIEDKEVEDFILMLIRTNAYSIEEL